MNGKALGLTKKTTERSGGKVKMHGTEQTQTQRHKQKNLQDMSLKNLELCKYIHAVLQKVNAIWSSIL